LSLGDPLRFQIAQWTDSKSQLTQPQPEGAATIPAAASNSHVRATLSMTAPAESRDSTLASGARRDIGCRYRVVRLHAQGGLGAVYVAHDQELNREVALKQMQDKYAEDPASRARFLLEAEVTGALEHPGVVPIYSLGSDALGRPYYAMRFIRGETLKDAIEAYHKKAGLSPGSDSSGLSFQRLLRRFVDVCNAIDYAHGRGVLHRDLKPANIVVGDHGETLVVDWGLAKALGRASPEPAFADQFIKSSSGGSSVETLPGSAMGTPSYMSPEQACGDLDRVGPLSDVYSLGGTLYCILTGRPPFVADDGLRVLLQAKKGEFPRPRQLDYSVPVALEAIVLKAMGFEPASRYQSARELADDVERYMADRRLDRIGRGGCGTEQGECWIDLGQCSAQGG
jgi:serine/threonine protein kinase